MTIPYDTDYGLRNAVLLELANDVVAAGGTVVGISQLAGETHPNWVLFLNQISAAVNAMGASPPLPMYDWLDRNSFQSVVNSIEQALGLIPQAPVVTPAGPFNITLPASNGALVATMSASNSPTSWAIASGNGGGFFMIANTGQLLTSATGSNMTAGTYNLGITATNAGGVSPAVTVGVNAA